MNKVPAIDIFCEGNKKVGYGHIRRAITLASQLEKDGISVRILGLSEDARVLLPKPATIRSSPRVHIFDLPCVNDDRIRESQSSGYFTVALDWFGATIPDVNIAVYPHSEVLGKKAVYIGFQYILIREDVASYGRATSTHSANNVLIVLGGGDLLDQGHETALFLRKKGLDVTLVQGPLASNVGSGDGYRVIVNPKNLTQLLINCDWVVTNGGGCLFEAICLGKAAFVLPQTQQETKIARYVESKRAILGIGSKDLRAFENVELNIVSERGFKLVDGKGASRISSIVRGLI